MNRLAQFDPKRLLSLILPIVFTVWSSFAPETDLRTVALVLIWITGLMFTFPVLSLPVKLLRRVPALLWVLWLAAVIAIISVWLVRFQPAVGIPVSLTEQLWLIGGLASVTLLPFAGVSRAENVRIGWLAGPLITLASLVLIVVGIELAMRYLWVMSDNFQFSKMHQNWNRLYWNPINEGGYRDYQIPAENDEQTQIIVMGDSLVTGYGVDNIADTFPHLLDQQLGDGYTVNIAAQPGWGVASAFGAVRDYPILPDVLVLSHYTNDINEGTAAREYGRPFPQIRVEPTESQRWWTDRFYIANFLYYRVFLYTQHDSLGLYNDWVYGAYADETVWQAYQQELQTVIDWTLENEVELVVIVWPDLTNIETSQTITEPVIGYFEAQDVPVIDMAQYISDMPLARRIVNPFDAHPSVESHTIAAEQLAQIISP